MAWERLETRRRNQDHGSLHQFGKSDLASLRLRLCLVRLQQLVPPQRQSSRDLVSY